MHLPEMDLHHLLGRKWFFAKWASTRLETLMNHLFVPVEIIICTKCFVAAQTLILVVVGFFVAILFMVVELCQRREGTWALGALIVVGVCLVPVQLLGRMFVSATLTTDVPRVTAGMLFLESTIRRAERTGIPGAHIWSYHTKSTHICHKIDANLSQNRQLLAASRTRDRVLVSTTSFSLCDTCNNTKTSLNATSVTTSLQSECPKSQCFLHISDVKQSLNQAEIQDVRREPNAKRELDVAEKPEIAEIAVHLLCGTEKM